MVGSVEGLSQGPRVPGSKPDSTEKKPLRTWALNWLSGSYLHPAGGGADASASEVLYMMNMSSPKKLVHFSFIFNYLQLKIGPRCLPISLYCFKATQGLFCLNPQSDDDTFLSKLHSKRDVPFTA
ncbi:hypothetical protein AVEN_10631-1 [Araneus ventricosus]|uniref:Uncharacterized protein n=1 Tax=Araneus ventricosus TaxID=182803 RepID=A0A4Y2ISJ2_ARAVE|nr:hypothetical protein AVEN_10631-1 [Araneus ventricosus]